MKFNTLAAAEDRSVSTSSASGVFSERRCLTKGSVALRAVTRHHLIPDETVHFCLTAPATSGEMEAAFERLPQTGTINK
jgi:hypothetical protein